MKRLINRLGSLLGRMSQTSKITRDCPLDYEQLIHLDAESLAEQGILSAYQELLPRLLKYSDSLIEVTEEIDDACAMYSVRAAGQLYEIWEPGEKNADGWERATVAFFQIVNASLKGSSYKFFALYGGNDLGGMFLTEQECAVARQALAKRSDWP